MIISDSSFNKVSTKNFRKLDYLKFKKWIFFIYVLLTKAKLHPSVFFIKFIPCFFFFIFYQISKITFWGKEIPCYNYLIRMVLLFIKKAPSFIRFTPCFLENVERFSIEDYINHNPQQSPDSLIFDVVISKELTIRCNIFVIFFFIIAFYSSSNYQSFFYCTFVKWLSIYALVHLNSTHVPYLNIFLDTVFKKVLHKEDEKIKSKFWENPDNLKTLE